MPAKQLTAYLDGSRVGWFGMLADGKIVFDIDRDWADASGRMEVSFSLPKSRRHHEQPSPQNYLWGLLPDSDGVLERWGRKFGVSPRNPIALLGHVGLDAAGGIQLAETDDRELHIPGGHDSVADEEIARHIAALRDDDTAWMLPGRRPQSFSLAGAQSKFALSNAQGSWAIPYGSEPTTHIFKPGAAGFERQDLAEHLTMSAAARFGFTVAHSQIMSFGDQRAIVVERYDRERAADGTVRRTHQEDFVQALGIHPAVKYQNDGGPGLKAMANLIRARFRRRDHDAAIFELLRVNAFHWLTVSTDAHAKNYALLHGRTGASLAPFYDMSTALPYPDIANDRRVKVAMSIGGVYRVRDIAVRHWEREALALGVPPERIVDEIRRLAAGVAEAYSIAAAESHLAGADARFAGDLVDLVAARAARVSQLIA